MIRTDKFGAIRLMTALIVMGVATVLAPATLDAQQVRLTAGRGYFQVGYQVLDLDALNLSLRAEGIPEFEEGFYTLGGGGHVERDRLLIGGEGHALIEQSETSGAILTPPGAGGDVHGVPGVHPDTPTPPSPDAP